ncbi:hypothetical protein Leryth_017819 [Lithospermum erythrorhizon]|nr:hypothetical protein Leryth_017819 [Lithospermum erythrorhizon]
MNNERIFIYDNKLKFRDCSTRNLRMVSRVPQNHEGRHILVYGAGHYLSNHGDHLDLQIGKFRAEIKELDKLITKFINFFLSYNGSIKMVFMS